jgi:hypothetical protein
LVLPINSRGANPLANLLTNVNSQASEVAFNIRFNQMQNTVIERINKESAKIANIDGNQRELDSLNKTIADLSRRRETVVAFAFANESNDDRFADVVTASTATLTSFSLGDADVNNLSAAEKTAFEANRLVIYSVAERLVELSHPDFVDGNNVTSLRSDIDSLLALTPVEGPIDSTGASPTTNDNLAISELLSRIASTAGAARDTSRTLQVLAVKTIRSIDAKLGDVANQRTEVSVFRAGQIEFELQTLRSKYANFLRSVELAFDTSKQANNALANALDTDRDPPVGSILSILS